MLLSEIKNNLPTKIIGTEIHHYKKITSTNDLAKELINKGSAKNGTVIIADEQTAGRGRLGRQWYSPPETGLWFSIILISDLPVEKISLLTLSAGLSVINSIKDNVNLFSLNDLKLTLKWPNDVLINDKKVCGILTEIVDMRDTRYEMLDTKCGIVIGIGVNVNQSMNHFPAELKNIATSLFIETNKTFSRTHLLHSILKNIESFYLNIQKNNISFIIDSYRLLCSTIGNYVKISSISEIIEGIAVDIDDDGSLIVRLESGILKKVWAGEIT